MPLNLFYTMVQKRKNDQKLKSRGSCLKRNLFPNKKENGRLWVRSRIFNHRVQWTELWTWNFEHIVNNLLAHAQVQVKKGGCYCNFTNVWCIKSSVASDHRSFGLV